MIDNGPHKEILLLARRCQSHDPFSLATKENIANRLGLIHSGILLFGPADTIAAQAGPFALLDRRADVTSYA